MFEDRPAAQYCVACHSALNRASLASCPRCGAYNQAWRAWLRAGIQEHLRRFFLRSPWGRLALVSLLLPLVSWGVLGSGFITFGTVTLLVSLLLSLAGLFFLFARRDALWTYELTRQVSPRYRAGLLHVGGAGFLVFTVMAVSLGAGIFGHWPTVSLEPTRGWVVLKMSLAFTANTLAAGLYAVYAYGRWLSRTFPSPVFLDEVRLLGLVDRAVKPRIQVKTGSTYEVVAVQVVERSRTDQAGLDLEVRAEAETGKSWQGQRLTAVQHWRVLADKWGRVRSLSQEGPLEYVPHRNHRYPPPVSESARDVLDGEIIAPENKPGPSIEEAIISAFTSEQ